MSEEFGATKAPDEGEHVETPRGERIELLTPVVFGGKEIRELALDLLGLTGNDLVAVEREMTTLHGISAVSAMGELGKGYLASAAARVTGQPVELILALAAPDFLRVTNRVRDFLLGLG